MNIKTKKYTQALAYIYYLVVYVISFWILSFTLFHSIFGDNRLYAYLGNILLMIFVLSEEKITGKTIEFLYDKLKKETYLKKQLRKKLATERYKPSMKSALYFYYIICLILGRVLILDDRIIFASFAFIGEARDYFSGIYYVLILLVAVDKFKEHFIKEKKYRDKYYARYEAE